MDTNEILEKALTNVIKEEAEKILDETLSDLEQRFGKKVKELGVVNVVQINQEARRFWRNHTSQI